MAFHDPDKPRGGDEELAAELARRTTAWPKEVAVKYCPTCAVVSFAKHVNREDAIPPRYCSQCGMSLAVAIYRFDRETQRRP